MFLIYLAAADTKTFNPFKENVYLCVQLWGKPLMF
jgi:hypothetical protein